MRGRRSLLLALHLALLLLTTGAGALAEREDGEAGQDGVMVKLKSGLQMAGKLLGLDAAAGVARLVAQAFGALAPGAAPGIAPGAAPEAAPGVAGSGAQPAPLGALLRLLALDAAKVGAAVVNALLFLAQMITSALVPKKAERERVQRKLPEGTPADWILDNPSQSLRELLVASRDRGLPDKIIDSLRARPGGGDTACMQLLVCKTAPFVWGMQRALAAPGAAGAGTPRPAGALFRHLPAAEEFLDHGDACERRHEECRLLA